jgi:hypothetical protein
MSIDLAGERVRVQTPARCSLGDPAGLHAWLREQEHGEESSSDWCDGVVVEDLGDGTLDIAVGRVGREGRVLHGIPELPNTDPRGYGWKRLGELSRTDMLGVLMSLDAIISESVAYPVLTLLARSVRASILRSDRIQIVADLVQLASDSTADLRHREIALATLAAVLSGDGDSA